MKKYLFLILLFTYSLIPSFAQQNRIDSLLAVLKTAKEDTNKVNALNGLAGTLQYTNPDSTILLTQQAAALSEKIKFKKGKATAYGNAGIGYYAKGDYQNALIHFLNALQICQALNNKNEVTKLLTSIGLVYAQQGDFPKALNYYFQALKTGEELGDKNRMAATLSAMGTVYSRQGDFKKGLDYYFKALKLNEELKNKKGLLTCFGNIGSNYIEQKEYAEALGYYFKALKIAEELGMQQRIATAFSGIGIIYKEQAKRQKKQAAKDSLYDKALEYYFKALKMQEQLSDREGAAIVLGNIGELYRVAGKFYESENYLKKSLALCDSMGMLDNIARQEESLSFLYDTTGRYQLALEHYKKYIAVRDSIANDENTKRQTRLEMNYEFEKKQTADSIKNAEQVKQEELKHKQEIQQQRTYTYGGVLGFLLMIVVAGVSFRAYKQKQKANFIISEQKKLVEEKQKDILDSIHYAKRIQQSLLPTEKYIEKHLRRLNG